LLIHQKPMGKKREKGSQIRDINDFSGKLARHLQSIYKSGFNENLVNRILKLINRHYPPGPLWDEKDIVLITYGNTLMQKGEPPLKTLDRFLYMNLSGIISCVHILPFFPYTSDDGFAVSDFMKVNSELGSWEHIKQIGLDYSLMFDLVINHVSTDHQWFKNYLEGRAPYNRYFIEKDTGNNYNKVIRPRNTPLFTIFPTVNGEKAVWTTFSSDQIDLDFSNPEVLIEMIKVLLFYIDMGVRIIRLDAIAFLWKEKGTSCLHLPQTHEIVRLLRTIVSFVNPCVIILTETNVPNKENWSYFGNGDEAHMVYQFSLPPLLLHALYSGSSEYLTRWAFEIPDTVDNQTFLNYTASHDGIGVRPLEGILPASELQSVISGMKGFGGLISEKVNHDGSLSPYEINITYFDAMKGDKNGPDQMQVKRFICSQSIMMAMRGIPAFYIHSLLGTTNYYEGIKATGKLRAINRRQWNKEEIASLFAVDSTNRRVFNELIRLIRIRKQYRAFHPHCPQKILQLNDAFFAFIRSDPQSSMEICCISNITGKRGVLQRGLLPNRKSYKDLITPDGSLSCNDEIFFEPYQTRWIIIN
jgi:sucrose phosphorylase